VGTDRTRPPNAFDAVLFQTVAYGEAPAAYLAVHIFGFKKATEARAEDY